jgi:hypothetical protein
LLVTSSTAQLFVQHSQQQGSAGWRPLGLADAINFWGGGARSPLGNSRGSPLRWVLVVLLVSVLYFAREFVNIDFQMDDLDEFSSGERTPLPQRRRGMAMGLALLGLVFLSVLCELLRIRMCLSRGDLFKSRKHHKQGGTTTSYRIDDSPCWVKDREGGEQQLREVSKIEYDARKSQQKQLVEHYRKYWWAVFVLVVLAIFTVVMVAVLLASWVQGHFKELAQEYQHPTAGHESDIWSLLPWQPLVAALVLLFLVSVIRNSLQELRPCLRAQGLMTSSGWLLQLGMFWVCYCVVSLFVCLGNIVSNCKVNDEDQLKCPYVAALCRNAAGGGVVSYIWSAASDALTPDDIDDEKVKPNGGITAGEGHGTSAGLVGLALAAIIAAIAKWVEQVGIERGAGILNTSVARIPMEKQLVWLSKNRFFKKCLGPLDERLEVESFDSTITVQLNTWDPNDDTCKADGLLSYRTLAVLDMVQLTERLNDGSGAGLLKELFSAASMTTDRHSFLFLGDDHNRKIRIMTMLLNEVSSHFRDGFVMRDRDPDSVVEHTYCVGLTNETGERVDQQKIRLFVTAKDTLDQLRKCDFEQLSVDMENEWKDRSRTQKERRRDEHKVWDHSPRFRRGTSREQCGGLRPEYEGGRVNRKRWQTLVEMAHLKAGVPHPSGSTSRGGNDLIWDVTLCIPKHQASQATQRAMRLAGK